MRCLIRLSGSRSKKNIDENRIFSVVFLIFIVYNESAKKTLGHRTKSYLRQLQKGIRKKAKNAEIVRSDIRALCRFYKVF